MLVKEAQVFVTWEIPLSSSPHQLSLLEQESKDTEKQKLALRPTASFLSSISDLLKGN